LLVASSACRKTKPPKEQLYSCSVSFVSGVDGLWSFRVEASGVRDGRGKVVANLFDVEPNRAEPNRALVCSVEQDVQWEAWGVDVRGKPKPSCAGDPAYGHYRVLSIALVPTAPQGKLVSCSFDGVPPLGFGESKTPEVALAESPNPIASLQFTETPLGAPADAGTKPADGGAKTIDGGAKTIDSGNKVAIDSAVFDAEAIDVEAIDSEPIDGDSVDSEPVDAGPPVITIYARVSPSWTSNGALTEIARNDLLSAYYGRADWSKRVSVTVIGASLLSPQEIAEPVWGDGRRPNVSFYVLSPQGRLEKASASSLKP
jgi:hypothetical protein